MSSDSGPMWDVLTLGETCVTFYQRPDGTYTRSVGGDGSNVAVSVVRMGGHAAIAGRIGADSFGDEALAVWRAAGVDARLVQRDDKARTAHGFVPLDAPAWMLRDGSAATRLRPGDLPASRVARSRVLHLTGTALGLSASARVALDIAADQAQGTGVLVSFAPTFDPTLWDEETAVASMIGMIERASILFLRSSEARLLFGVEPPEAALARLLTLGPQVIVMAWDTGVWIATPHSKRFVRAEANDDVLPTDDVAWSALIGTYLSGLTAGEDLLATAHRAVQAATLTIRATEPGMGRIPALEDLKAFDDLRAA